MRLIDADLLGLTDMEIIMCDGDYKEALKMLIDKIDSAPAIEPERKKGKWIYHKDWDDTPKLIGWICPVCGRGVSPFTNVCPCNPVEYKITTSFNSAPCKDGNWSVE